MNQTKTTGAVAAVLGMLLLSAVDAAAQAPVMTYQQSGSRVLLTWNAIAGATTYEMRVTGALNLQGTLPTTYLDVTPPPGTYNIQVRANVPGAPFSVPLTVVVGGGSGGSGPCSAPAAPDVTVSSGGGMAVLVTWPGVSGAIGYRVQVGRSPGVTEFSTDLAASQTSFGGAVPFVGTYYIRVLSGSACGATAASTEKSITVGTAAPSNPTPPAGSGSGPREPDPQPGVNYGGLAPGLLPMPDYAAAVVADIGRRYAGDLVGHAGPGCKAQNTWLFKLLRELRTRSTRWGLNWKRGWDGSFSTDVITYNPTNQPDEGATQIYLSDVISGECESNIPVWNWTGITHETWEADHLNPGLCNNRYCAKWTLSPYLQAGYPLNP